MAWSVDGAFVPQVPLSQPILPVGQAVPIIPPRPIGPAISPTVASVPAGATQTPSAANNQAELADLSDLVGTWEGRGINIIWRPNNLAGQDHFLEIDFTKELLSFKKIGGKIPNRGLLQADISMSGLQYFQEIQEIGSGDTLHIEPGLWLSIPATTNPLEPSSYARLASIPHGTTILLQGTTHDRIEGFPEASIKPFFIGSPQFSPSITTSNLSVPSLFRSPIAAPNKISQNELDNPNLILNEHFATQKIVSCKTFMMSSSSTPIGGGGLANTVFLQGSQGSNAKTSLVTAILKIQHVQDSDGQTSLQIQTTQTVMLDFAGLSWPHVSICTLQKLEIDPEA